MTCESGDAAYLHANYLTRRRKSGKLPLIRSRTQAADRHRARTGRRKRERTKRRTSGRTNGRRQMKGIKQGLINLELGGASLYCMTGDFFFLIFLFSGPQLTRKRGRKKRQTRRKRSKAEGYGPDEEFVGGGSEN